MIDGKDDERISAYLAPPELHLHTGTVNKHNREINEKWGDNKFYKWCAKKNIQVSTICIFIINTSVLIRYIGSICFTLTLHLG